MSISTPSRPEVLILGYHKIGPIPPKGWASWYYTPTDLFVAQLKWLRDQGYAYLAPAAFIDGLTHPERLPAKNVLITFDDGYRSLFQHGLPEMEAVGCPAIIFIPTLYVGKTNSFDEGNEPLETICSWEELAELERRGVAVGSHGVSHRTFGGLSAAEIDAEIGGSKREIESHLGHPIGLFSFPFGDNSAQPEAVEHLLKKHGYQAAFLYKGDPGPFPPPNPYRITRVAVGMDTDLPQALNLFARR